MPKTATPQTLNERIARFQRDAKAAAFAQWRTWIETLADGGSAPEPGELLRVAALLRVRDPAHQLEADATALAEHRTFTKTAASCRATAAELVKPHGNISRLRKTIAASEAELVRLRQLLADLEAECQAQFWDGALGRIEREHPLLWPPAGAMDSGSMEPDTHHMEIIS